MVAQWLLEVGAGSLNPSLFLFFWLGKRREMRHAPWRREAPCESLFFLLVTSALYLAFGPATD